MRAIQGHSGGNKVDPSLQDNVEFPFDWIECIYHVGSSHDCDSIIKSCLIGGRKDTKEARQTVLFTAVDPVNEPQEDEPYDVRKARQVPYRTTWKVFINAVYWINLKSNAMMLDSRLSCKSGTYQKRINSL